MTFLYATVWTNQRRALEIHSVWVAMFSDVRVPSNDDAGDHAGRMNAYCTGMYGGNRRGVRYANNPPHVGNPPSVTRYGWTMRQP